MFFKSWPRAVVLGCLAGLLLALGAEASRVLLGFNCHTVVNGLVYRSSQLSAAELENLLDRHGIRTIINLRGNCDLMPWYPEECRTAHRQNVSLQDIGLSAGRLPSVTEVRQLVKVLDQSAYPILLHCRQGADRTGLVSAMILLLYTDTDYDQARRQLGLRYGHVSLGRTTYMGRFYKLYEDWLAGQDVTHSPARFRQWLLHEYTAGACLARLEVLDAPTNIPHGKAWSFHVRAHNISSSPWHLSANGTAGHHLGYSIANAKGKRVLLGQTGLFEAEVPPGKTIELTVALPALKKPGKYFVQLDMTDDQQQCWFYQDGSEPVYLEVLAE